MDLLGLMANYHSIAMYQTKAIVYEKKLFLHACLFKRSAHILCRISTGHYLRDAFQIFFSEPQRIALGRGRVKYLVI